MAFMSKFGNMLKHTASSHINLEFSAPRPSLYQAIRCMSSSKLFVGGISYGTDEMSLRESFAQHGEVVEARIIMDRETGRSRGFGFVTFTSSEEASNAIQAMDGQELQGRRIRVNYATERPRTGGFSGSSSYYNSGDRGYGFNNYNSGGAGYGSIGSHGNNYGGDSNYGGVNPGGYGMSDSGNYKAENGFSGFGGTTSTAYGGGDEQLGGHSGSMDAENEGFVRDTLDDNDEPKDFANPRV